jgi:hypothetical protein
MNQSKYPLALCLFNNIPNEYKKEWRECWLKHRNTINRFLFQSQKEEKTNVEIAAMEAQNEVQWRRFLNNELC